MTPLDAGRIGKMGLIARYSAWMPRAECCFAFLTRLNAFEDMHGACDMRCMAITLQAGLRAAQAAGDRMQVSEAAGRAWVVAHGVRRHVRRSLLHFAQCAPNVS
jgi:hypothetical protein